MVAGQAVNKANEKHTPMFFDAEALGASFKELAVDVVRGETTEFVSRWFRAAKADADLMIWFDGEKRIIKHQMSFFGQVVEWNPIHGTRTGLIIEEETITSSPSADREHPGPGLEDDGVSSVASNGASDLESEEVAEMIRFDSRAQAPSVEQAIRVLGAVPELSEPDRARLIYNLRESPKLHKNARERALKAWAPKVEELTSNRRPSFWKRLRRWVLGG